MRFFYQHIRRNNVAYVLCHLVVVLHRSRRIHIGYGHWSDSIAFYALGHTLLTKSSQVFSRRSRGASGHPK